MRTKREELLPWIQDYLQPRYPELVELLLGAADAFDRAKLGGNLDPEDLQILADAASSARTPLGESAALMLGQLARDSALARDAIIRMSKGRKVHIRVNALVALQSFDPCDLHKTVARLALHDPSARLRELAADLVRRWRMSDLLPELEASIQRERNDDLRKTLEAQRDLLRDGYKIEHRGNDVIWVTFQTPGGGLTSTHVSGEEWRAKGLAAIAGRLGIQLERTQQDAS